MDEDSCSKFIGSLTKYLQSLCHSYVEFETGVELVGHIYLNVDTAKKIDYVLNESVCKNGANVVKFTSNSYHAQPVEKQKSKKITAETPTKSSESDPKKKADDDDVIIVGSEASRTRGSRLGQRVGQPGQMQRGVSGNSGDRLQHGMGMGTFRSPRGPNPRMSGPYGGVNPRMVNTYQQGYRVPGQMAGSTATQPQYPGPGMTRMRHRADIQGMNQPYLAAQQAGRNMPGMVPPQGGGVGIGTGRLDPSQRMQPPNIGMQRNQVQRAVNPARRASDPVDTDITFMREEYVRPTNQQDMSVNPAAHMQPHQPHMQGSQQHSQASLAASQQAQSSSALSMMTQRFGYSQTHQEQQQQQQQQQQQGPAHLQPRFQGPYSHNVPYNSSMAPGQAGAISSMGTQPMMSAQQDSSAGMASTGIMNAGTATASSISPPNADNSTMPPVSQSASSTPVGLGGGMPLPVTTHSIFDDHLPVSSSSAQGETTGNTETTALGTMSLPVSTPQGQVSGSRSDSGQGGLMIDQVWSQSTALGHGDSISHRESVSGLARDSVRHDQEVGFNALASNTAAGSRDTGVRFNSNSSSDVKDANIFDILSDFQPSTSLSASLPSLSVLSNSSGASSGASNSSAALQANFLGQPPLQTSTSGSQIVGKIDNAMTGTNVARDSQSSLSYGAGSDVKLDPGQIGVTIATSVLQETTEAAVNEVPAMFLAPLGITDLASGVPSLQNTQGSDEGNKRSGSSSSVSLDALSPFSSASQVAGQDSTGSCSVRSASQPHTSDYESGGDSASTEKLASPQHLSSSQRQLRPLSISLVPVDSTMGKQVREKREVAQKQNSQDEWTKDSRGVTSDGSSNSGFESEDLDDDDIDPSYKPPTRSAKAKDPEAVKGIKRGKARQMGKTPKGKKRKTQKSETGLVPGLHPEECSEDPSDVLSPGGAPSLHDQEALPSSPPASSIPAEFSSPPPLSTPPPPPHFTGASPSPLRSYTGHVENLYKPGSFVLLHMGSERSRTRSTQCPAEVISTPKGQPDGIWVHTLHSAGGGLWQLPNEDQIVDLRVEPGDIKQVLNNASVKIVGSKVFYKFEDRILQGPE